MSINNVTAISDFWPPHGNERSPNCDPADPATPTVIAEELGKCKKPGEQGHRSSPRQLRCVRTELTQQAQSLASPRPSNAEFLNLTPDLWFSAACSLCCKLAYILTYPPDSLEQFSQSYWDSVSRAWSPEHSYPIKWLSAFRLWLYFFSWQYICTCVSYMCICLHITYMCVLHVLAYACMLMLSCVGLCDHMGCDLPGSSVHGIFQAIILEWVAISYSRRFPNSDWTHISCVSCHGGQFFTTAPRGNPYIVYMCIYYLYRNIVYTK